MTTLPLGIATRRVPVTDEVTLAVLAQEDGPGPASVLVHGLASNARLWDGVAAALPGPSYAVDLRGHGRSDKPEHGYALDDVVGDLVALLEALGLDRPLLAGQSWGANVVLELAHRRPGLVRGVLCVDGALSDFQDRWPQWSECRRDLAPPQLDGTPWTVLEQRLRRAHPDWPEEGVAATMACFERRPDGTVAPWLTRDRHLEVLHGLWEHRPSRCWPTMQMPVCYLGAAAPGGPDAGKRAAADAALAALPAGLGRLVWMTGDHDLHAQHPAAVAARLQELA